MDMQIDKGDELSAQVINVIQKMFDKQTEDLKQQNEELYEQMQDIKSDVKIALNAIKEQRELLDNTVQQTEVHAATIKKMQAEIDVIENAMPNKQLFNNYDLKFQHMEAKLNGMTKRIFISNLTREPENFLVKLADKVKATTNIHWFKSGQQYVVLTFDQTTRDSIMPTVKQLLRGHQEGAKARPWLTRMEMMNKQDLYQYFSKTKSIQLIDWGTKVLLVKGSQGTPDYVRKVFNLAKDVSELYKECQQMDEVLQHGWSKQNIQQQPSSSKFPRTSAPSSHRKKGTAFFIPSKSHAADKQSNSSAESMEGNNPRGKNKQISYADKAKGGSSPLLGK